MAEAKTRKNTFFVWIPVKQMNECTLMRKRVADRRRNPAFQLVNALNGGSGTSWV